MTDNQVSEQDSGSGILVLFGVILLLLLIPTLAEAICAIIVFLVQVVVGCILGLILLSIILSICGAIGRLFKGKSNNDNEKVWAF